MRDTLTLLIDASPTSEHAEIHECVARVTKFLPQNRGVIE